MHVLFTSELEPVKDKLPLNTVQRRVTCIDIFVVDGDRPHLRGRAAEEAG